MCDSGGNTTTTSVQLPPELMAQLRPLWLRAGDQANQPYLAYGQMTDANGKPLLDANGKPVMDPNARRIAGFNPDQNAAFNMIRADAGLGPMGGYIASNGGGDPPLPGASPGGQGYSGPAVGAGGPAPPNDGGTNPPFGGLGPARSWMPDMGAGTLADIASYQPERATATSAATAGLGPAAQMSASQMAAAQATGALAQRGNVRDVQAGSLPQVDLANYTDPFTENVVNTSLADLARQNDILNNRTNARAAAEGAFGGSRSAVLNSLNNEALLRQAGQLSAGLRSQGFTQAQNTAEADLARQIQANLANQGVDLSTNNLNAQLGEQTSLANANLAQQAGLTNAQLAQQAAAANQGASNQFAITQAQLAQQANLANAGAANQMALANQNAGLAGAGLRLNAGNSLANNALQQQQYASNVENRLAGIGTQEQGLEQQNLNLAYQDFQNQRNWPWTQMARESSILRGTPLPTTTTQTAPGPSLFGQIAGLGLAGAGLFGLSGGGRVGGGGRADGGIADLLGDEPAYPLLDGLATDDATAGLDFMPIGDGSWTVGDTLASSAGAGPLSTMLPDPAAMAGPGGGQYIAGGALDPMPQTFGTGIAPASELGANTGAPDHGSMSPSSPAWLNRQALIAAGLGMMASRAPNALAAIGEGGLMGLRAMAPWQRGGYSPYAGSRSVYLPRPRYAGNGGTTFDDGGLVPDGSEDAPVTSADLSGGDWQPWSGASLLGMGDDPWADGSGIAEHLARISDAFALPADGGSTAAPNAGASDTPAFAADPGLTGNGYFGSYVPSWMSEPGTVGEHLAAIFDAFRSRGITTDEPPPPTAWPQAGSSDGSADSDPGSWLYDGRGRWGGLA